MTSPAPAQPLDAHTIAELNDLLQLDRDAIASYELAIRELKSAAYRETVRRFRTDHERHAEELTGLIRRYGGMPLDVPHPSGLDKLALQAAGEVGGGDPHTLVAFRNNERQARDKYARAAGAALGWPGDVRTVVRNAAEDEERHYGWVDTTLQSLGITDDRPVGVAARALESFHSGFHDAAESVERQGMWGFEAARRAVAKTAGAPAVRRASGQVARQASGRPLAAALVALGVGVLLGSVRRSR